MYLIAFLQSIIIVAFQPPPTTPPIFPCDPRRAKRGSFLRNHSNTCSFASWCSPLPPWPPRSSFLFYNALLWFKLLNKATLTVGAFYWFVGDKCQPASIALVWYQQWEWKGAKNGQWRKGFLLSFSGFFPVFEIFLPYGWVPLNSEAHKWFELWMSRIFLFGRTKDDTGGDGGRSESNKSDFIGSRKEAFKQSLLLILWHKSRFMWGSRLGAVAAVSPEIDGIFVMDDVVILLDRKQSRSSRGVIEKRHFMALTSLVDYKEQPLSLNCSAVF